MTRLPLKPALSGKPTLADKILMSAASFVAANHLEYTMTTIEGVNPKTGRVYVNATRSGAAFYAKSGKNCFTRKAKSPSSCRPTLFSAGRPRTRAAARSSQCSTRAEVVAEVHKDGGGGFRAAFLLADQSAPLGL